jgi:hypothetical protein
MIMASLLQIVYYPKGKLSLLNAELYQRIDGYDQFYFLFRKLAVEQGFLMSIILRSLTMMHEMV